uniref:Uncharacterized protein n=1 Tax=Opuntia streptacantha TaxID=393608 RepID=A0A7C9D122_OPUST
MSSSSSEVAFESFAASLLLFPESALSLLLLLWLLFDLCSLMIVSMVSRTRSPYLLTLALPMPLISSNSSFVRGTLVLMSFNVAFPNMWYARTPSPPSLMSVVLSNLRAVNNLAESSMSCE